MATFEIEAAGKTYEIDAPDMDTALKALGADGPASAPETQKPAEPGMLARAKDAFTGELRTEFPDAPEFASAFTKATGGDLEKFAGVNRSNITSDHAAALDILRKQIPGLEAAQDKHGNVMLKAPGMSDWAYLNKPGLSARDVDEFGTQTLAALPFLGMAGQGATIPARIASGMGFMGAGELARQGLEKAAGSEQQPDTGRLAFATGAGGVLAPGAPSAALGLVTQAAGMPVRGVRNVLNPGQLAERRIAEAFRDDLPEPALGRMYRGPDGQRVPQNPRDLSPEMLQARAADALQERSATPGGATYGGDVRLMDIGGESTRRLARATSNLAPEAGERLNRVIQPRFESQGPRFVEFLQEMSAGRGSATAQQSRDVLEDMAYNARGPFYDRAFFEGADGFFTPQLRELQRAPAFQDAMERATREMLNKEAGGRLRTAAQGPGGPTLEYWDQVKRLLQSDYNRLAGRGQNAEAANVAAITERLIDVLDQRVGSYADARGVAMGIFRANNALDAGENFVRSRISNEQARRALAEMNPQEQDLFRQGYVGRLIDEVHELGDRRSLMSVIGQSPAARERLELALGPEGARDLEAFLHNERMMDFIRGAVNGNSTTARQLRDMFLASSVGGALISFDPSNPTAWIAGILTGALTKRGAAATNRFLDTRLAMEIADRLVSRDPSVMRRGLQQLSEPRAIEALRAFDEAISTLPRAAATQGANPSRDDKPKLPNAMRSGDARSGNAMADGGALAEGSTATNPQTGERVRFIGGRWVPVQ